MRSIDDIKQELRQLLPKGVAWNFAEGTVWSNLIDGMAQELFRVESRGQDLLRESDPRTTNELIGDWERITGLPDDCTGDPSSVDELRRQILARLTQQSSLTKQFFVNLASTLGYDISVDDISEYSPFVAGSFAGQSLTNLNTWAHTFKIVLPSGNERHFRAGTHNAGDALVDFGDDVIECLIAKTKPAHSIALIQYV